VIDDIQYLTPEGLTKLEKRLQYLVEVRRSEIVERLRMAHDEGGDIRENADYADAKDDQSFVVGEIERLEFILSHAQVIEAIDSKGKVALGSLVKVTEEGSQYEETYQLVSSVEANPNEGKISLESPLGQALIGAKVGDKVTVLAPEGELIFLINVIDKDR
jgi:transcription elongation factor GreA